MVTADVIVNGNTIEITCSDNIERTIYWHCNAQGTFTVSKNSGKIQLSPNGNLYVGNDSITIRPISNQQILGYVEFVIDDELCPDKWKVNVSGDGELYIFSVTPLTVTLNGSGSIATVRVNTTSDNWFILDGVNSYFKAEKTDNTTITITSLTDEIFNNIEFVVSDNITSKVVTVKQEEITECTLDCSKYPESGSTYQISVASYSGSSFISYDVDVSLLENFGFNDDGLGNINAFVKDLTKEAKGTMIITNACDKKEIEFNYVPKDAFEEQFVIYNGDNEYTAVTINFGNFDTIQWNGSQINMPFDLVNDLPIRSIGSDGNFCSWQPIQYDTDRIQLQYDENTLSIGLNDISVLDVPGVITLQNDCGRQILISYTVSDGLSVKDRYIFGVGNNTGTKGEVYTIDYNDNGIDVYIDSYLQTQTSSTDINWNCVSTDRIIQYTVEPMNGIGGINNKVHITASEEILNTIESDYVGTVIFQQLDGDYLECQVEISHKGREKTWFEVSRKLVSFTVMPSSIELGYCEEMNYSEEITCTAVYEVTYEYKTSADSDISYGTKSEFITEDNGYVKITWTKESGSDEIGIETLEHTDATGTYYTYRCYAPKNQYLVGEYRTAIFVGSIDTSEIEGDIDIRLQCNQNISSMEGGDIEGEKTVKGVYISFEIVDENGDGIDDIIPRSGDTREFYGGSAELQVSMSKEDECGNVIPDYDDEETEIVIDGITIETDNPEMLQLDYDNSQLIITENPWKYTFTSDQDINDSLEWYDDVEYNVTVHSDRKSTPRSGNIWAVYTDENGTQYESDKKKYDQEGGDEYVEYRVLSKPDWCTVTLPSSFDYDTTVTVNVSVNENEEERSGEIVLEQILPEEGERLQLILTITQDGMIYIPNNGCKYTPIPMVTYTMQRQMNVGSQTEEIAIYPTYVPLEIYRIDFDLNNGRVKLRPVSTNDDEYTVEVGGGVVQQGTSDVLGNDTTTVTSRNCGGDWFHGRATYNDAPYPNYFIFHKINQGDADNGTWVSNSFYCGWRKSLITLFGYYYLND